MIWLQRIAFIIRLPFAVALLIPASFIVAGAFVITLEAELFEAFWEVMVRPAILEWPR